MLKNVTHPPEPGACNGTMDHRAYKGIMYFNAGEYFEAHEWLELAWRDETGAQRDLYRGILQVGVAYHHILHSNYTGAIKLFRRCRQWLEPFPDGCLGLDLAGLWRDFLAVEAEVKRLGPDNLSQFNPALLKPIHFKSLNVIPKEEHEC